MGSETAPFTIMVKVKMFDKGLNTVQFGFLEAGSTVDLPGHFVDWLVKSKRAEVVNTPKKKAAKK